MKIDDQVMDLLKQKYLTAVFIENMINMIADSITQYESIDNALENLVVPLKLSRVQGLNFRRKEQMRHTALASVASGLKLESLMNPTVALQGSIRIYANEDVNSIKKYIENI